MLPTNGDGSARIKYLGNNKIEIVTGNGQRVLVGEAETKFFNDVNMAGGGMARFAMFVKTNVLQSTTPIMTASIVDFSGTAGAGNGTRTVYLKRPLPKNGSLLGLTLYTEDTVKSGSLSGTILIDGVPTAATLGMNTGSVAYTTWAKDTYTFSAGAVLSVQLTASSTYLN